MSIPIRVALIIGAVLVLLYFMRKVSKSQIKINDILFWFVFAAFLVVLGIFPQIATSLAGLLGFQSPANFVWLTMITLLLVREFIASVQISQLRSKLATLTQEIALADLDEQQNKDR